MDINPKDFGAVGDGKHLSTAAIQKSIDQCFKMGGGTVFLKDGVYLSGGLYLKSNVTLYIDKSAKLIASGDISDYGTDTHYNRYINETDMDRCFIYAVDCENIGLMGNGEINGNAEAFPNEGSIYRPMMIRFLRCRNIKVRDLRLYNSAAWTSAFLDSEDIYIDSLDIKNDKRYNGDGLDFDGCQNVFVSNCKIYGTDDNLCLQSSSKEYDTSNIHITGCMFTSICAGIRIGLKSIGNIKNTVISNCTFKNIWREGIKIECSEGGNISNIAVSNCIMENVRRPIFAILNNRFDIIGTSIELKEMPKIGTMSDISFDNIIISDTEEMKNTHIRFNDDIMGEPKFGGIRIDANKDRKINGLSITNLKYTAYGTVKKSEVDMPYPKVLDLTVDTVEDINGVKFISENYYPTWSRASHMDIRNVNDLYLANISLKLLNPDERDKYIIEDCSVLKQEIF
ncbi:MAG: right-handed parallel beta-helix repeat-containing protein [Clostridia bacterium]|nr:right-handed parallel beta-helix repeat-containing protein [Clostridia bacterium]